MGSAACEFEARLGKLRVDVSGTSQKGKLIALCFTCKSWCVRQCELGTLPPASRWPLRNLQRPPNQSRPARTASDQTPSTNPETPARLAKFERLEIRRLASPFLNFPAGIGEGRSARAAAFTSDRSIACETRPRGSLRRVLIRGWERVLGTGLMFRASCGYLEMRPSFDGLSHGPSGGAIALTLFLLAGSFAGIDTR